MKDIITLAEYLRLKLPEFTVLEQFPDAKVKMKYPTISIIDLGTPTYTNLMPVFFKRSGDKNVYIVGQYDKRLQLDVWTNYKNVRNNLYEAIHDVFMGQFIQSGSPSGLSLVLKDYHNAIARYDIVSYTILDNEASAQVSEWRVKLEVVVNYPKLISKDESLITEATIMSEVGEEANTDNYDINETLEVF